MIRTDALAVYLGTDCLAVFRAMEDLRVIPDRLRDVRCSRHRACSVYVLYPPDEQRVTEAVRAALVPREDPPHYDPTPWHLREEPDAAEREETRRWAALDDGDEAR